jgi:hypothetical protein
MSFKNRCWVNADTLNVKLVVGLLSQEAKCVGTTVELAVRHSARAVPTPPRHYVPREA